MFINSPLRYYPVVLSKFAPRLNIISSDSLASKPLSSLAIYASLQPIVGKTSKHTSCYDPSKRSFVAKINRHLFCSVLYIILVGVFRPSQHNALNVKDWFFRVLFQPIVFPVAFYDVMSSAMWTVVFTDYVNSALFSLPIYAQRFIFFFGALNFSDSIFNFIFCKF